MVLINDTYQVIVEEMKSKFIAIAMPISSVDDFKAKLKAIEKEHHKARHVVYAYRLDNVYKSTDNGEPKGTAGRPLLELLLKKDVNNIALIVVRYFGGTKLGASKLLRTYLSSGVEVLKKAGI